MTSGSPGTPSRALAVVLWGLGLGLLLVLGLLITFSIGLRNADQGSEDEARRSVLDTAEQTLAQLRQGAEDGELTDADIAAATGAAQGVREVNRTDGEITISSVLHGSSSGVAGPRGADLCMVFTLKQPLGPGSESYYREVPACPETTFSPATRPSSN